MSEALQQQRNELRDLLRAYAEPNKNQVGKVTTAQVREIAQLKKPDLNAFDEEAAMKMIMGTARSMGIEVA